LTSVESKDFGYSAKCILFLKIKTGKWEFCARAWCHTWMKRRICVSEILIIL